MTAKKTKAYVQFSKRVVVGVTIAVTAACYAAIAFCFFKGDMEAMVNAATEYIKYATIVFAAYSGNSAVEKWLVNRGKAAAQGQAEETSVG